MGSLHSYFAKWIKPLRIFPVTMEQVRINFVNNYKIFRTTKLVAEDIKMLRKLNNIFYKLHNSEKDIYAKEIINILTGLNNVLELKSLRLTFYHLIDIEYATTFDFILDSILEKNA